MKRQKVKLFSTLENKKSLTADAITEGLRFLCVHQTFGLVEGVRSEDFDVSHVASGQRFGGLFKTEEDALAWAKKSEKACGKLLSFQKRDQERLEAIMLAMHDAGLISPIRRSVTQDLSARRRKVRRDSFDLKITKLIAVRDGKLATLPTSG